MSPEIAKALWYRALEAEIGISVEIKPQDKKAWVNFLYKVRDDAKDPELQKIIMLLPGKKPNEIWLCKKTTELPDAS